MMDIELWLIFTNRVGKGETKGENRGTVKNSLASRDGKAQTERKLERRKKGRKRERNIKRKSSEENIFPFPSPSISSSNFVAVSQ